MTTSKYIVLTLLLPFFGLAQQELSLHSLSNVWQANRLNPAVMPDNGFTIGLPSVYNRLAIENVTLNDLLLENVGGQTVIYLEQALTKLEGDNALQNNFSLETLSFDFRLKENLHLSLHHATRFNIGANYPKSLAELIWLGNGAFVGETIEFAPEFDILAYHEFGLGIATKIGKNISLGAKIKLLNGIGHAGTSDRNQLSLFTDEDIYQLTLDADYQLNSSAILTYDGFGELDFGLPSGGLNFLDLVSKNVGIALDFGGIIEFEKISFGISVLDIGSLHWRTKVNNYTLDGTFEYDGIDAVRDYLDGNTTFENVTDTLRMIFDVQETQEAYSTSIPTRLYANATYQILESTKASAIFYGGWQRDNFQTAVGLNLQQDFTSWLSAGAAYMIFEGANSSLGLNANAQFGPVQIYAITQNIGSVFNPRNNQNADFRVGLNLLFRRD